MFVACGPIDWAECLEFKLRLCKYWAKVSGNLMCLSVRA